MSVGPKSFMDRINNIDVEDLQYVETDLCFYQLRLIILSQHPPRGKGWKGTDKLVTCDILTNYTKLNIQTWRLHVVEALAIIKAKRVLSKLGLNWLEIYHHFLPHVAEISVHIHPLLKALYSICERLTPDQAGKLVYGINAKCPNSEDLRFYDFLYLEVFLLNWLAKRIIKIGDRQLKGSNIQLLIEYFKFNDMDGIKDLLLGTINENMQQNEQPNCSSSNTGRQNVATNTNLTDSGVCMSQDMLSHTTTTHAQKSEVKNNANLAQRTQLQPLNGYDRLERYVISRKNAGYVMIINQRKFYKETDVKYRNLVPDMYDTITKREGTNVDRDKLKELFSTFGYNPLIFENLTHLEMLHQIRETVKKSLLKDSIIICILSHGMEGVVFGCNSVPVAINEVRDILKSDTLIGKPKMLIIQACQRYITNIDTSSSTAITAFSPDAYADILLAMSSIPGTDALRHTEHGSWFVDSLCKLTQKYGDRKHMLDILTAVTRDISLRKGDANQVMLPLTSSTMRKEFYLPPRV